MKTIRLSGIAYESLVNGPGLRRVFFSQGCKHNCKGCFNKETHDFNGGEDKDMDELIRSTLDNPFINGVTFSGGDPFERAKEFTYMAKKFKGNGLDVWSYTGYKFEELIKDKEKMELLSNIDVLVDGKFEEDKKSNDLKFKGSSNQRIIDVKNSLSENESKLIDLK